MTLSVLVPVRDGERYVAESLDSVLGNDPPPDEVVVVDDGSTDATPTILDRFGQRIVRRRTPPLGLSSALNEAIAVASGDLLTFHDSDDLWTPGRSAPLLAALDDPDVDAAFGLMEQFADPDLTEAERAKVRIDTRPQIAYLHTTMVVRRTLVQRVGRFDTTLSTSANLDWMSRARAAGMRSVVVPVVVTRRRVHASNLGRRLAEQKRADLLRVIRSHHHRRSPDS